MVMAQSLFKSLKHRTPEPVIDVLAPAWSKPILDLMPEVSGKIEMPVGHGRLQIGERWRVAKRLRPNGYSQAILLPNTIKSTLIPLFAGIPLRTGWVGEQRYGLLNDIRKLDKAHLPLMVQRFVALSQEADDRSLPTIEPPALVVDPERVSATAEAFQLSRHESKILALCPGAEFGPAKQWPYDKYAELAKHYIDKGWAIWLFGSNNDAPICAAINKLIDDQGTDLSGQTQLAEAVDLLSLADAVVSNDSGLMHVAAALERPLVVIYGSTDPGYTPPLNQKQRIVRLGLDCSPCFKRECPEVHLRCLKDLPASMVSEALDDLLS
jgi:heptosyltransferase-2